MSCLGYNAVQARLAILIANRISTQTEDSLSSNIHIIHEAITHATQPVQPDNFVTTTLYSTPSMTSRLQNTHHHPSTQIVFLT